MIKRTMVKTSVVFALVVIASGAHALQFEGADVMSSLNEPLDARVAISHLTPTQAESIEVRLAAPRYYERFGFERELVVGRVNLEAKTKGSGPIEVYVTTKRPVTTSIVSILVEATTKNGRYFHRYDLLINPAQERVAANNMDRPSATAARDARSMPSGGRKASGSTTAQRGQLDVTPAADYAPTGDRGKYRTYGPVKAGQTLWSIAEKLRPNGATIAQTAVALYRASPRSFEAGIGSLEAGAYLTVPYKENIVAIDPQSARRIIASGGS